MADRNIAASDIVVTVSDRWFSGRKRFATGTLSLLAATAAGADDMIYASGGVPLPAIGNFGMPRIMDALVITGTQTANPQDMIFLYDKKNNKLLLYEYSVGQDAFVEPVNEIIIVLPDWGAFSLDFFAVGS